MPRSAAINGCVDVVDRLVDPILEDAVQGSNRQDACVVLRQRPVGRDDDPAWTAGRERRRKRRREPAEARRQRDERAEHLEVGLLDDGNVDRRRHETALERRYDLLGDHHARAILGLGRRGREMRRDDHLLQLEELAGVRLRLEHVERCSGDGARPDRGDECGLVDELASRRVHDPHAWPHAREGLGVEQPARVRGQRQMQRDDVRLRVDVVQRRGRLDSEIAEAVDGDEGVVRDDAHPEAQGTSCNLPADTAEAEKTERPARELDAREARPLPPP